MAERELDPRALDALLAEAESAARAAGAVLLDHYERGARAPIRTKSSARDLVSAADLAAERVIVAHLRRVAPDCAIESEEEVHDALDRRPRWFVDPLDGTVNFVHGLPVFSVSIALYQDHEPLVAVVHAPKLGETFTARRGGGARLDGRSVRVSETGSLGEALLATGFPYRRGELQNDNVENFVRLVRAVRGIRRMGSAAIDLACVAAGRFDGFWELHLSPHDLAAGALLVREAGGIVTDVAGGEGWLRGGHVVAAGSLLHEAIRSRLDA